MAAAKTDQEKAEAKAKAEEEKQAKLDAKAAEKGEKEAAKVKKPQPLTDQNAPIGGLYVGTHAKVVSGEHEGKHGAIIEDLPNDSDVILRTRDDNSERIVVAYNDLRPDTAGQR
jgi:sRNA-binding protein